MSKVVVAILAMFAVVALVGDADAQKKRKCPKGKVFSAGKCITPPGSPPRVTPRGSH